MSNNFEMTGLLGRDPELKFSKQGLAIANTSVADTPRRFNKDSNQWEDAGATLWMPITVFGADAERLTEQARKGDKVTVYGHLKAEEWQDKQTGEQRGRTVMTVDAFRVHERRQQQGGFQGTQQGGFQAQQQQDDPWGSAPATATFGGGDDAPPF